MMKINEKNLCSYAVSPTPIDKEGYLNKRSEGNRHFQRRYFVLKGNLLFYFEKKGDKEPVGVIVLEGSTIELDDEEEVFSFKIVFRGANNRSYLLAAESQETMEQWMKALACASYDYIKLMVAELRAQLDEIDEAKLTGASPETFPVPPPRHGRHNPFNKPENSPHQRSHSMRSSARLEEGRRSDSSLQSKATISFWELHNTYGRPILQDFNIWKNEQRKILETVPKSEDNLIVF